jgi:hypothetical protein
MYRFRALPVILISVLLLSSCSLFKGKKGKDVSPTTGWSYNDPDMRIEVRWELSSRPDRTGALLKAESYGWGAYNKDEMFD